MVWSDNKERPKYVTKKLAHTWQPFVDRTIRTLISKGKSQDYAVDRALDLRDEHIKNKDKPPKGKKK